MEIRLASIKDGQILAELNRDVQQIHAEAWPSHFREPTNQLEVAEWFKKLLTKPQNQIFIGESAGEAVGYLYCEIVRQPGNPFNHPREFVYIHQISVKPVFWGQGYGRSLMGAATRLAKSEGVNQVLLDTWSFNTTAKAFFEIQGFIVFNERMHLQLDS